MEDEDKFYVHSNRCVERVKKAKSSTKSSASTDKGDSSLQPKSKETRAVVVYTRIVYFRISYIVIVYTRYIYEKK